MKLSKNDIETLQNRVEFIKIVVKYGENPFRSLSYLKTFINELQNKCFAGEKKNKQ